MPPVPIVVAPGAGRSVRIILPAVIAELLAALATGDDGTHPVRAPGPAAAASTSARERDPLADLEAQFVADDLERQQAQARAALTGQALTLLASRDAGGHMHAELDLEEAVAFTQWLNHQYVRLRVAELTGVETGAGQSALGLLGFQDENDDDDPGSASSLPVILLSVLVSALTDQIDAIESSEPRRG